MAPTDIVKGLLSVMLLFGALLLAFLLALVDWPRGEAQAQPKDRPAAHRA